MPAKICISLFVKGMNATFAGTAREQVTTSGFGCVKQRASVWTGNKSGFLAVRLFLG